MSTSKDANNYVNILDRSLTSEEYHTLVGSYSSSQLKDMLADPEIFYKKYITKEVPRQESAAFDLGTYFHTAVLEPHKLQEECAVYTGLARRGKEWEEFKEKHKNKAIITKAELETATKMVRAVQGSPIAMKFISSSEPEVSAFIKVYVMAQEIFSFKPDGSCWCLMSSGWVKTSGEYEEEDIKDYGQQIILKVRADSLGRGTGTISDLKSTSGNALKPHEVQTSVGNYQYDLSAALYLDIFTFVTGEEYDKFVWIFASKTMGNAKCWQASDRNIMVGRAKWRKAVTSLAHYIENGWAFTDELGILEPQFFAVQDWLN